MHLPAIETDLYQLTMAQGYWKLGRHLEEAVFNIFFRENPFEGAYTLAAGLENIVHFLEKFEFTASDIEYLSSLTGENTIPLFEHDFLVNLKKLKLTLDVDAIPEGRLAFPREPLIRVTGPLWQCQLVETGLLTLANFSSLIATKASRVVFAAKGDPVIEFGLRRAQGPNGGLTASRAAFIGGVAATSNTLAGKLYHIPVRGTHAHSWVMSFKTEMDSFTAYAEIMPQNCILLVDTYNTIEGVKQARDVCLQLKREGHTFFGIRLDSGDLAMLSSEARKILDEANLQNAIIVGSNDLDEYAIQSLKERGAKIDQWGVGSRLVTGYDQPALGGVYKLVALKDQQGKWHYKAKTTDDPKKKTLGGINSVRRFIKEGLYTRDVIFDPLDETPEVKENEVFEDILVPIFRKGKLVHKLRTVQEIQIAAQEELSKLPLDLRVLRPNKEYPVVILTKQD